MTNEREAFEAWVMETRPTHADLRKNKQGAYLYSIEHHSWKAWQAATAAVELDRAQRGEPVLWRYRDSEQVIRAMDGYTPVEGWTPLYTATQPAHTEAEVQEILDSSLREWGVFEQTVRIILNVEKP